MAEKLINPDDYLSDIIATARYAYLCGEGEAAELYFTDNLDEASDHWYAEVVPGDYVPKSLPLQPPRRWAEIDVAPPSVTYEPRSMYPDWMLRLQRSRNGVEIVVVSLMAGTAGALLGFAIGSTY